MSVKARDIITYAYREVHASRSEITDGELQDGLRYLNRMMATFAAQGADVGYSTLSSVDDVLTSHPFAVLGIVKNLAKVLQMQYRTDQLNPLIASGAKKGRDTLQIISMDGFNVAQYPSTLPVGSGNIDRPYDDNFYSNEPYTGTFVAVEDATIRRNE